MSKVDFNTRKNIKLEDRVYLSFEFYGSNGQKTMRILPFFENPIIEESERMNVVKYQPLGRSRTLATYSGAESRNFSVSFKITLPNVLEYLANYKNSSLQSKLLTKSELTELFLMPNGQKNASQNPYWARKGNATDWDANYGDVITDDNPNGPQTLDFQNAGKEGNTTRRKTIDIIMYWINLIRSSVLNNSKDPTYGPPIVRLNSGILYQDIPCICLDHRIATDEVAGIDLKTLLPRVVQVTMNLMEYRVGNFGNYDVTDHIARDNVVGWESIIGGANTIDPIRSDIGKNLR